MKKISRPLLLTIGIVAVVGAIFLFSNLSKSKSSNRETVKIDPGFTNYISGFTSGIVSSYSTVRVRLKENLGEGLIGEKVSKNIFKFQPNVNGDAVWIDASTIEFKPDKPLKSGEKYICSFALNKLKEVEDKYKTFQFEFSTIKQSFLISDKVYSPYRSSDLKWNKVEGTLKTADYMNNEDVEKILTASQDKNKLSIRWEHNYDEKKHAFVIDSILRKEDKSEVEVVWDGSDIDVEVKGSEDIEIPGLNQFNLMTYRVLHQPDQHVVLTFSDPIQEGQNLDGLIEVRGIRGLKFSVDNNQVKIFPPSRLHGNKVINISQHIKNSFGYKIKKDLSEEVNFESLKPAVRMIGKGVILPNSNGLHMHFEAVNLTAVDVRIIKIYEDNIAQFLQFNNLDGNNQMSKVGRLIIKKKIDLISDDLIDYGRWNAFSFDLGELINTDPGAIYRVEVGFKQSYSIYPCEGDSEEKDDDDLDAELWEEDDQEMAYWDGEQSYYSYHYGSGYDWRERDNPCHSSYYTRQKTVARNILASDLGIIAKSGSNNEVTIAVTDILSAQPMPNINVEVYNYQQQLIGTTKTDNEGFAKLSFENKPFLLVAKSGNQRGYLKLDDGSALALSKFDVGGQVVQKGIKGFIYGERGVWRPGDSLYLTFILSDKENTIPDQHPVKFELINPFGQTVKRMVSTQGENGFYNFSTKTESDAPTGNWNARVQVGGVTFQKRIKIETVKPNRIKIDIDFGTERITRGDGYIRGTLESKWLHGAVAKDLKAIVDLTLSAKHTSFSDYKEFVFDDPSKSFASSDYTVYDGTTGTNGLVKFSGNVSIGNNAPGMLRADFFTTVYEKGGDFSVNAQTLEYAPYDVFVGVKTPKGSRYGRLLADKEHRVEVVTVSADGNPQSVNGLVAEIYKIGWRWWWESSYDNLGSYITRPNIKPILTRHLNTEDGKGSFTFTIKKPEWGRFLVRIKSPDGHSTGKIIYIDWPGYSGRANRDNPEGASMLTFSADKEKYSVGEKATLNIPSSEGTQILVSLESGTKVIKKYWVKGQKEETAFQFDITEEMSPNIFANVSLIQPHVQTVNDLPIRLYGVIPIEVEDKTTILTPVLNVPKEVKSESTFNIEIKEEQGKEMTYTLAIVDEGLLGLTNFRTPNPWDVFYAREALGVKTWDLFDYIIGAYGGNIEALFAIGGDEGLQGKKPEKANRFKPVVKFIGPFTLKRNGKNTHSIQLPQYIGAVRVMAIAGNELAFGNAEESITVKNPLMLLATLPRVLGPGEKVKLPVTLFTMDPKVTDAKVKVEANEFFEFLDGNNKQVNFGTDTEKDIMFDLGVIDKTGIGKVNVEARSGSEKATYNIEIDVRNPNPPVTKSISSIIQPGDTWEQEFEKLGIQGTNSAQLEVSCIPPIDFGRRLRWLVRYPHGCIEQTTSAAFPQLYLSQLTELTDEKKEEIKGNVEAAIERIKKFNTSDGGFGYWPGANHASEWGSSYAGHFLLEAEKKGYEYPKDLKQRWIRYQKRRANNWSSVRTSYSGQHDLVQSYRLYTLALAGSPELGAMNRFREKDNLSVQAKWRLAAAFVLAGKNEVARELTSSLSTEIADYASYNSYTYGSAWRDMAMILETLVLMEDWDTAATLLQKVAKRLSSNSWMSTHTTAYCLMSIAKVAGESESVARVLDFEYGFNTRKLSEVIKDNTISQHPYEYGESETHQVRVKNNAKSVIYATLTMEGTPSTEDASAYEKNLKMDVSYFDLEGNAINPAKLAQGTEFKAIVKVTNPGILGYYENMALTQIFPSGWEISNTRLFDMESTQEAEQPTYLDIRDDRVYTYFNIGPRTTKHYVVVLTASYLGEFYLPSVYCEAMYDNTINAKKPGQWVKVVRPGE